METPNSEDLRQRRNVSQIKNPETTERQKKRSVFDPDQSLHKAQESLLTSTSGYNNYRGLLNLCVILLILSNSRVALENIMKYGILIDPLQWIKVFMSNPSQSPSILLLLSLNIFVVISLFLEKALSKNLIQAHAGKTLVLINLFNVIVVPPIVVYLFDCHPVGSSIALALVSILFLKLVSYHMFNMWCREAITGNGPKARPQNSDGAPNGHAVTNKVVYPNNLNFKDIYYFIFVPTLCYELNYVRTPRIRKKFLLKRLIEMFLGAQLMLCLIQQWMVPTINNSLAPFQEMHISKIVERLLKLAIPNHIIWLMFFYWYFHSCLNCLAEITRFPDRMFYKDWWNSSSINYFWANWNIPVHKWCVRHLYIPLLRHGLTNFQASVVVFIASAFFHEYLVSVPLKMFRVWAFTGMLAQVPFSYLVSRLLNNHEQFGNIAVWVSLILGQPLCILMYYHDYYVLNLSAPNANVTL